MALLKRNLRTTSNELHISNNINFSMSLFIPTQDYQKKLLNVNRFFNLTFSFIYSDLLELRTTNKNCTLITQTNRQTDF